MKNIKNVTLLVSSCKDYTSLLDNFFIQFKKHFPEFDGDIVINTFYDDKRYNSISKKYDEYSWSCRTKKALSLVKTPYILILMDDYYLKSNVDSSLFSNFVELLSNNKRIGYLKLYEHNKHIIKLNKEYYNKYFFNEGKRVKFSISLQAGLWKKTYLNKVLRRGEDAWVFERNGSYRSYYYHELKLTLDVDNFMLFDYFGGSLVKRGLFSQDVVDYYVKNEGLNFDNIVVYKKEEIKSKKFFLKKIYERVYLPLSIFFKIKYR